MKRRFYATDDNLYSLERSAVWTISYLLGISSSTQRPISNLLRDRWSALCGYAELRWQWYVIKFRPRALSFPNGDVRGSWTSGLRPSWNSAYTAFRSVVMRRDNRTSAAAAASATSTGDARFVDIRKYRGIISYVNTTTVNSNNSGGRAFSVAVPTVWHWIQLKLWLLLSSAVDWTTATVCCMECRKRT